MRRTTVSATEKRLIKINECENLNFLDDIKFAISSLCFSFGFLHVLRYVCCSQLCFFQMSTGGKAQHSTRESSAALFLAHQDGEVQRELDEIKEYRQRALTMNGAGTKPPTLMETLARVLPLDHHTPQQHLSSAETAAVRDASDEVALGEEAPAHIAAQVKCATYSWCMLSIIMTLNTSTPLVFLPNFRCVPSPHLRLIFVTYGGPHHPSGREEAR